MPKRFALLGCLAATVLLHGCPKPLATTPQNPAPARAQFALADCDGDDALTEEEAQYFEFWLPPSSRAFGGHRVDFRVADQNWNSKLSYEELSHYLVYNQRAWSVSSALDAKTIMCEDDGVYTMDEMSGVLVQEETDIPRETTGNIVVNRHLTVAELEVGNQDGDWRFTEAEFRKVLRAVGCVKWSFEANCRSRGDMPPIPIPNPAEGMSFAYWWPSDIARDSSGHFWVASGADEVVTKVSPEGKAIGSFVVKDEDGRLTIDPSGHVWVLHPDYADSSITRLSPTGERLNVLKLEEEPRALAFDAEGRGWLVSENSVSRLAPDGTPTKTLAAPQGGRAIAIDASGRLWIANDREGIVQLSPEGEVLRQVPVTGSPRTIVLDPEGHAWVLVEPAEDAASGATGYVAKVSPTGEVLARHDLAPGSHRLFVSPTGHPWLIRPEADEVVELSPEGEELATYQTGLGPWAIAFDQEGQAWVTHRKSHMLKKVTPR